MLVVPHVLLNSPGGLWDAGTGGAQEAGLLPSPIGAWETTFNQLTTAKTADGAVSSCVSLRQAHTFFLELVSEELHRKAFTVFDAVAQQQMHY